MRGESKLRYVPGVCDVCDIRPEIWSCEACGIGLCEVCIRYTPFCACIGTGPRNADSKETQDAGGMYVGYYSRGGVVYPSWGR